jgi:16S rRNA (uracil1498-N3)-methyltransferase
VLGCAVVKGRRFEWVLEKAVELGAHRIVPLRTERGVVTARPGKQSRWQSLLVAALKQSGRALLPELAPTAELGDLLDEGRPGLTLFGSVPGETEAVPWTDLLHPVPRPLPPRLTLLVGPEGGWTPAERGLLREGGARAVGLGPHVLRTETAAVAGLAALQALRQAWRAAGEA